MSDSLELDLNDGRLMALLLKGLQIGNVLVVIDTADPDVVLPSYLTGLISLEYGLDMVKPIPDLRIDRAGVLASLSFKDSEFMTFVPWSAVRGFKFAETLEVASTAELDAIAANPELAAPKTARKPPVLKLATEPKEGGETETLEEMSTEFERRRIEDVYKTFGLRAV